MKGCGLEMELCVKKSDLVEELVDKGAISDATRCVEVAKKYLISRLKEEESLTEESETMLDRQLGLFCKNFRQKWSLVSRDKNRLFRKYGSLLAEEISFTVQTGVSAEATSSAAPDTA